MHEMTQSRADPMRSGISTNSPGSCTRCPSRIGPTLSAKSPVTSLRATRPDSPWRSFWRAWATRAPWRART